MPAAINMKIHCEKKRCGAGTARTVTFCLCGSGSGISSRTGFGSGSNKKVNKSKMRGNFSGNHAASDIEKARFCTHFLLLENCA
jgi:hypothetical protein